MNFASHGSRHTGREVETTEWEDVLVKKGIVSEREEVRVRRELRAEAQSRTEEVVDVAADLERKTLAQLDTAEDDFDDADAIDKLRRLRLAELKEEAARERFGEVYPLAKADFVRDVSEASKELWVVVEMFKDGIRESTKCSELLREVAAQQKACKFMRIRSTDCVEGWPDSSVPCLFLYHEGVMQEQIVGLDFCGGPERATAATMEFALSQHGVFKTDLKAALDRAASAALAEAMEAVLEKESEREVERHGATAAAAAEASRVAGLPAEQSRITSRSPRKGVVLANLADDDDDDW